MILDDGISKNSENKYDFDYSHDLEYDLIHLCDENCGLKTVGDLAYFYAYRFNPEADENEVKDFRKRFRIKRIWRILWNKTAWTSRI